MNALHKAPGGALLGHRPHLFPAGMRLHIKPRRAFDMTFQSILTLRCLRVHRDALSAMLFRTDRDRETIFQWAVWQPTNGTSRNSPAILSPTSVSFSSFISAFSPTIMIHLPPAESLDKCLLPLAMYDPVGSSRTDRFSLYKLVPETLCPIPPFPKAG